MTARNIHWPDAEQRRALRLQRERGETVFYPPRPRTFDWRRFLLSAAVNAPFVLVTGIIVLALLVAFFKGAAHLPGVPHP